jgi:PQQ-dependent dehydrogenase (methanol/ethanol family)
MSNWEGLMGRILKTLCLGVSAAALAWPASANDKLIELEKDHTQWVSPTQNYANTRFSTLDQINKENVGNLQVAWTFSTGVLRGHEGGPLVIGDTMYVHTPFPNIVYALDLNNDGAIKWKYEPVQDPNVIPVMCCDTVNRGVAYAPAGDGYPALIILHQADTTVAAINAETGEEVWKVVTGDTSRAETGTNAPMVVKDLVISGVSGGEFGVQGYVVALNLKDGSEAWRAFSTGPDDQTLMSAETTHLGKSVGENSGTATWEATSGRSAAARRGAGMPTIRRST